MRAAQETGRVEQEPVGGRRVDPGREGEGAPGESPRDKVFGEEYVTMYLEERCNAAERVHDPRGELEKMLALLDTAARGDAKNG